MKHFLVLFMSGLFLISCMAVSKSKMPQPSAELPPNQISAFHEAVRLKIAQQWEASIQQFEKYLLLNPKDDAAYFALYELYSIQKNSAKALQNLERAHQLDTKNTWYIQELAFLNFEQQNYEQSQKYFEKLLKVESRNPDFLYGYAECLVKQGKAEAAIEALNNTQDQVGVFPELSIQKFNLYQSIKQTGKAENELLKALDVYPNDPQLLAILTDFYFQTQNGMKAVQTLEALVKSDPNNGRAHMALADIYRQQNKYKQAMNEYLLAFQKDDVDLDSKIRVCIKWMETPHVKDPLFVELLNVLSLNHPSDAKVATLEGDYWSTIENKAKSLKAYQRSISIDPSKYVVWNQVLLLEFELFHFDDLLKDSKECINLYPTMPVPYLFSALSNNRFNHFQEAKTMANLGIDLTLNDNALLTEFYVQLGIAYLGLKNDKEATKSFDEAKSISNNSDFVKKEIAYHLAYFKIDIRLALEMIEALLAKSPDDPIYLATKGYVLMANKSYTEAETVLLQAIELDDTNPEFYEYLGDVQQQLGKKTEAQEKWQKAFEMGLQTPNIYLKINSANGR